MRNRRGLSSVVGMVFAIIAIVTSVSYVTYSLSTLDQYNQSTLARNQQSIDAGKEGFQLYSMQIPANGKFNITIANTGSLPINITRMWVQNTTTGVTDWTNFYTINKMVGPGSLLTNIGQCSFCTGAKTTQTYNIKLVTGRGNALQFSVGSANVIPLFVQSEVFPTTLRSKYNVTLIYMVTNNVTSNNALVNLAPTATCVPHPGTAGISLGTLYGPFPSQIPSLAPGETATFKWITKITNSTPSNDTQYSVRCTAQLNALNAAFDTVWMAP